MGRVFRFEEVAAGQVPTHQDFEVGKQDVISTLSGCEDITGAIICGSLLHGTSNRRSDIDIVLYHLDTPSSNQVIRDLRARCEAINLEVNILAIDPVIAQTRYHTITWGYMNHLEVSIEQGGLIKQNFLPMIDREYMDPYDDVSEYISFKMRYLGKSIDEMGEIDPNNHKHMDILQKGLELPVHIARKYLNLNGFDCGDESKRDVMAAYRNHAPRHLSMQLEQLVAADKAYTDVLERQLAFPNYESYKEELNLVAAWLPASKAFARENALLLRPPAKVTDFVEVLGSLPDTAPAII